MKQFRPSKVLGLAIGERSLTAAEVLSSEAKPEVRRLGEFVYPEGTGLGQPAALGKALAAFLRENKFSGRVAVVGVPTKWVVAKPKELPPSDGKLAADLLRLQAEGDFSSELKDLVYDYAGEPDPAKNKTVLLLATAAKYIQQAQELCEAARLDLTAVTISAATLGSVTGRAVGGNAIVLATSAGGSELTAQTGGATSVLRHLRGPTPQAQFVSEVRRAVSLLPSNGSTGAREMIVWDGAAEDPAGPVENALHTALGLQVRRCDLGTLGVTTGPAAGNGAGNGTGRRYAAAVALALAASTGTLPVDFLHSRLAAPKTSRVPRWAVWAVVAGLLVIVGSIWAYKDLKNLEAKLATDRKAAEDQAPQVKSAEAFVNKVSFAQGWHGGDPRYLACLRELTKVIPDDSQTYATSLSLRDLPRQTAAASAAATAAGKAAPDPRAVTGTLTGKTNDQAKAIAILDGLNRNGAFKDCKSGGSTNVGREVSFTITFTYTPPLADAAAPATQPAKAPKK